MTVLHTSTMAIVTRAVHVNKPQPMAATALDPTEYRATKLAKLAARLANKLNSCWHCATYPQKQAPHRSVTALPVVQEPSSWRTAGCCPPQVTAALKHNATVAS